MAKTLTDICPMSITRAVQLIENITGYDEEAILTIVAVKYLDRALKQSGEPYAEAFALDRRNKELAATQGVSDAVNEATLALLYDTVSCYEISQALFARMGVLVSKQEVL